MNSKIIIKKLYFEFSINKLLYSSNQDNDNLPRQNHSFNTNYNSTVLKFSNMVPFKVDNSKPYFYYNTSQQQAKSTKNSNTNNLDLNRKFSGNSQNSNGSNNSSNELNNQNTKIYNNTYNNAYNNYYSGNGNGNYYKTNNNENNNYDYYPKGNKNKNYNKANSIGQYNNNFIYNFNNSKKSEDNINIHKKSLFNNMDSPSSESKGNSTYYSSIAQEKGKNLFLNNAQSNNECEDCNSRSTSNTATTIEEKNEIFSEFTSDLNTKQTARQVFMTHYEGSCNYSIFNNAITPCFSESALQNIVSFIVMKN